MDDLIKKTCVVIPAYNSIRTIQEVIVRIQRTLGNIQIIVVDDGSSDGTGKAAAFNKAIVLRHEKNCGKGSALQTGFTFVKSGTYYEFILTMDSDLQHQPEDSLDFFSKQREAHADIVIGTRRRFRSGMPIHRIISNTLTSALVSIRTGINMKDSQCGYRLVRRKVFESIDLETPGFEAETEFLMKAAKLGFRVEFVPIHTVYGDEKSNMTHWATTKNFIKVVFRKYT